MMKRISPFVIASVALAASLSTTFAAPAPAENVSGVDLYRAAFQDDESGGSALLRGADVKALDRDGRALLFFAGVDFMPGAGAAEKAQMLIDAGAPVDTADSAGRTPLIAAAAFANSAVAKTLLNAKADVNHADRFGMTPLLYASAAGDWFAVKEAGRWLQSPNAKPDVQMERTGNMMVMQYTPAPTDVIDTLISAGANVNAQSHDGWTALMIAATSGWMAQERQNPVAIPLDAEELKLLVSGATDEQKKSAAAKLFTSKSMPVQKVRQLVGAGAKLDLKNNDGKTALDLAKMRTDPAGTMIVEILEGKNTTGAAEGSVPGGAKAAEKTAPPSAGGDEKKDFYGTAMESYIDAFTNDAAGLPTLTDYFKPRVAGRDSSGCTLLHAAALDVFSKGGVDKANCLIKAGAEVDAKDGLGRTPFMFAAWAGNTPLMKVLLDAGAKPQAIDSNGWNALMYVSAAGDWMATRRLVLLYVPRDAAENSAPEINASIPKMLEQLPSPLPALEQIAGLAKRGANPAATPGLDQQSSDGWTALMIAASAGWIGPSRTASKPLDIGDDEATKILHPHEYGKKQEEKIRKTLLERAFAVEKVKSLLQAGARTDLKNADGLTALDLAKKRDDAIGPELVKLLESK